MSVTSTSAQRIALALFGAAHDRVLSSAVLVGAARILGVSDNAMRVALTRLVQRGDVTALARGRYRLSDRRARAFAHVRAFRTGFSRRVPWHGGFVAVLTAMLSRRHAGTVTRRESALELAGFRLFAPGLHTRPDNLEGGPARARQHLVELGLDDDAEVFGVTLSFDQAARALSGYALDADAAQAAALCERVVQLLSDASALPPDRFAAESFFLGDEVLRFLARDPLLPPEVADVAPRATLAEAMAQLDDRARALWIALLDELAREEAAA